MIFSLSNESDYVDYAPFSQRGGLGKGTSIIWRHITPAIG